MLLYCLQLLVHVRGGSLFLFLWLLSLLESIGPHGHCNQHVQGIFRVIHAHIPLALCDRTEVEMLYFSLWLASRSTTWHSPQLKIEGSICDQKSWHATADQVLSIEGEGQHHGRAFEVREGQPETSGIGDFVIQ